MRTLSRLTIACVLLAAGCGPKVIAPPHEGPAGQREKLMSNCPSAVKGAATTVKDAADGVILDITADDPVAAKEILTRGHLNASRGEPLAGATPHTGQHTGPGTMGHCPIIHVGTTITIEDILGGVRVTVVANDPAAAPALKRQTRERLAFFDPAALVEPTE